MDLSTTYLGFTLPHPIVPGASSLADELDSVKRLEDAGAPAIVLRSLFEEQLTREVMARYMPVDRAAPGGAAGDFPGPAAFVLSSGGYLEHLRRIKAAVGVPVVASLNGTTPGGWLEYARLMEQAGADAIELNVYHIATDFVLSGADIERRTVQIVREVRRAVGVPVAVKLSPFYTSLAHVAWQIDDAGANGLVLFNRFYQPDIDVAARTAERTLHLSTSSELLPRLHWTAILSGRLRASLAVTGGVHTAVDVVKATMAGAHATQMVSALLQQGPEHLTRVLADLRAWLDAHECASLAAVRGTMALDRVPDAEAYERVNYMLMLQSQVGGGTDR
jgi:dihydroorotate dehydrogenase (fumarate)